MNPGQTCRILSLTAQSLDADHSREIDFLEFIDGMALVASLSHKNEKLEWAYKLYDVKRTGALRKDELVAVLGDRNYLPSAQGLRHFP